MKRPVSALIFAVLCLFYLFLVGGIGRLIGAPERVDPNTAGYYLLMDLPYFMMILGSAMMMLVGSPLAIIGYLKLKPNCILAAMIVLALTAVTYYGYPITLITPFSLGILGYFAYKDVLRFSLIKKELANKPKQ